MANPTGYVIYRGPSLLDREPIVVVATIESRNAKTGDMVQTWILRADMEPHIAIQTGQDVSVCGNCPARGTYCYVEVYRAPLNVFRTWLAGKYPDISHSSAEIARIAEGRMARLGAYGDPAAAPMRVWRALLRRTVGHTGYTHQWATLPAPRRRAITSLCMASADSPEQAAQAHALGIRPFRVRMEDEPLLPGEFICPAADEGGKRLQCIDCGACSGTHRPGQASPVIIAHGSRAKRYITMRIDTSQ